jgi:ribosomal protein S18 acetylase RimI-like enzyme
MTNITYRSGVLADSYTVFKLFEESLADLARRVGNTSPTSIQDPEALARMWQERRSLYEHLAQTADQFWIAEREGQVIGFSRSTVHDGVRELTELFVLPGVQSAGLGRELLARAFPAGEDKYRIIISSVDIRAQALYLKAGVYPRFPIYYFGRRPEPVAVKTDLAFVPITAVSESLAILGRLDEAVIHFRREADHRWLGRDRQGYLYYRDDRPVGYGYIGLRNGPFALLEATDFPAVLAHAETQAAQQGRDHFGLEVPLINQAAVDHLLSRGFQMDTFIAFFMSDQPFGQFENYVVTSPPFFL